MWWLLCHFCISDVRSCSFLLNHNILFHNLMQELNSRRQKHFTSQGLYPLHSRHFWNWRPMLWKRKLRVNKKKNSLDIANVNRIKWSGEKKAKMKLSLLSSFCQARMDFCNFCNFCNFFPNFIFFLLMNPYCCFFFSFFCILLSQFH